MYPKQTGNYPIEAELYQELLFIYIFLEWIIMVMKKGVTNAPPFRFYREERMPTISIYEIQTYLYRLYAIVYFIAISLAYKIVGIKFYRSEPFIFGLILLSLNFFMGKTLRNLNLLRDLPATCKGILSDEKLGQFSECIRYLVNNQKIIPLARIFANFWGLSMFFCYGIYYNFNFYPGIAIPISEDMRNLRILELLMISLCLYLLGLRIPQLGFYLYASLRICSFFLGDMKFNHETLESKSFRLLGDFYLGKICLMTVLVIISASVSVIGILIFPTSFLSYLLTIALIIVFYIPLVFLYIHICFRVYQLALNIKNKLLKDYNRKAARIPQERQKLDDKQYNYICDNRNRVEAISCFPVTVPVLIQQIMTVIFRLSMIVIGS
jgi:hypothetical protein